MHYKGVQEDSSVTYPKSIRHTSIEHLYRDMCPEPTRPQGEQHRLGFHDQNRREPTKLERPKESPH